MTIYSKIKGLIQYGMNKGLLEKTDEIYVRNRILEILDLEDYEDEAVGEIEHSQNILDSILDYAYEKGLIEENTVTYRDLMDARIMDCLMPRPSEVIKKFYKNYEVSPKTATDDYYNMAKASNYIRTSRTDRNIRWKTKTDFGELDITINLSKPEKDPRAVAAAKLIKSNSYPLCVLCKENEGYRGRVNHPARQNHRVIPLELCGEEWFLQYSPYVYYNEHSIVFKGTHEPMGITKDTFRRLLDFTNKFPHYFIGSNADLPIVGGSILSHDHFQGGRYNFAMASAPLLKEMTIKGFEDIEVGIVKWPMSVIRLRDHNREKLVELGETILHSWRNYSDESVGIFAYTDKEPHNTITPIARYRKDKFELDLVLRNNRTSEAHPLGIFHPHRQLHHIKKENIGLIEVMGLAVLPGRLKEELELIRMCLLGWEDFNKYEGLNKHKDWFIELRDKYKGVTEGLDELLKIEVGKVFERVLLDAGVFKQNDEGIKAFQRFIYSL